MRTTMYPSLSVVYNTVDTVASHLLLPPHSSIIPDRQLLRPTLSFQINFASKRKTQTYIYADMATDSPLQHKSLGYNCNGIEERAPMYNKFHVYYILRVGGASGSVKLPAS